MTARDDFTRPTCNALAKRAAYFCSNPDCRRCTLEPSAVDPSLFIYTGVASHICAASEGGPRYDATMTPAQRKDIANGIHLCATCSVGIDKNCGIDFTVAALDGWKLRHEEWVRTLSKPATDQNELIFESEFTRKSAQDLFTLRRFSQLMLDMMSSNTSISVAGSAITLNRLCVDELAKEAVTGSIVVVGEPGAGKSSATCFAAKCLIDDGYNVIILGADKLSATSIGTLRDELDLTLQFHEVLEHWPGLKPGILVIDALDMAKSRDAQQALIDLVKLIQASQGRWQILVSIRKFDLRYSHALRSLFPGTGVVGYSDPEFGTVKHISIPTLSDRELTEVCDRSDQMAALLAAAGSDLRRLLSVPYNLRLAAEVIDAGCDVESFAPIHAQIQLLELYWRERVTGTDGLGDARDSVLREVAQRMISRHSMQASRNAVTQNPANSVPLQHVLHSHVLVEWQHPTNVAPNRAIIAFAHAILFDYAVARLVFRGLPEDSVERLEADNDLIIAVRPSIVIHFQYEWFQGAPHAAFWELVLQITASPTIPEIGKLIGPSVAAEFAQTAAEFCPLLDAAECPQTYTAAVTAIGYVRGAIIVAGRAFAGDGAPDWCGLIEAATRSSDRQVVSTLVPLLMHILDNYEALTPGQLRDAGLVSRRVLELGVEAPV